MIFKSLIFAVFLLIIGLGHATEELLGKLHAVDMTDELAAHNINGYVQEYDAQKN